MTASRSRERSRSVEPDIAYDMDNGLECKQSSNKAYARSSSMPVEFEDK
jgi:hypothetical protein